MYILMYNTTEFAQPLWGINCEKCVKSILLLFLYNQDFPVLQILSLKLSVFLKSFIHRVLIRIPRFSSQYTTKAIFLWLSLLLNKLASTLIMLTITEIFQISCFLFNKEFETLCLSGIHSLQILMEHNILKEHYVFPKLYYNTFGEMGKHKET